MKVYPCDQGGSDWLQARLGKVTASEAGEIMTPLFAIKDGETPKTYLAKKLAEDIQAVITMRPSVKVVGPGAIKSEGIKAKRVLDLREKGE